MEPISITLLGYSLFQIGSEAITSVLGQVLPNVATDAAKELLKHGWKTILERAHSGGDLPANHDLQRAARRAYLYATYTAARQYQQNLRNRKRRYQEWIDWAEDLCDLLKGAIKLTHDTTVPCPESKIHKNYDLLLKDAGGPEESADKLKGLLIQEIIKELEEWHQKIRRVNKPDLRHASIEFEGWLKDGWAYVERKPTRWQKIMNSLRRELGQGAKDAAQHNAQMVAKGKSTDNKIHWFPLFAAFFTEELKTSNRLEAIYTTKTLLEMKEKLAQHYPAAAGLDVEMLKKALEGSLTDSLDQWGKKFCERLDELHKVVKEGNYVVLDKLAALETAQERGNFLLQEINRKADTIIATQGEHGSKLDSIDRKLDAAGLRASRRIPIGLPPRATAEEFFGRKEQLKRLTERLQQGKNSGVVGPAGLGKTALAAEAVRAVVGDLGEKIESSPYPDGVVLLDLYKLNAQANLVFDALVEAFLEEHEHRGVEAKERAKRACVKRRALIIFEGAEEADGLDGRCSLAELLAVLALENTRLILTRNMLQVEVAERIEVSHELEEGDAEALFEALTQGKVEAEVRDNVLKLLAGHPLAITWAGGLLARGDEAPEQLAKDWSKNALPPLNDPNPEKAEHTLKWLYERSVRGLTEVEKKVLRAGGLLAHAPFPLSAIMAALKDENNAAARQALKRLVQSGFLRLSGDQWQFTHVLAYQYAGREKDGELLQRLGAWAWANLEQAFKEYASSETVSLSRPLLHAEALLRRDTDHKLWEALVNFLLYDAVNRLTALGRLELVGFALQAVKGWLEAMPSDMAKLPEWQREYGMWCQREADLRGAYGNLGEVLTLRTKAKDIAERLARQDGKNTVWQRDLSVSWERLGEIHAAQGDLAQALQAYTEAMSIRERLAQLDPKNTEWQRDLSISWNKLGDIHAAQGNLEQALSDYTEYKKIAERLAQLDPKNTEWQRDLSISWNKLGDIHAAQGNLEQALKAYTESMSICERLAQLDGKNTLWQHDVFVSHANLADVAEKQGDITKALEQWEKGLTIIERLAALDKTNATWREHKEIARGEVARLRAAK